MREDREPDERTCILDDGLQHLRDLPWRRTRDPWAVLVSEVMLQQTQVARVLTRWERFLHKWPSPASCAASPLGDVLEEWQGLGYPRRARNLWLSAAACVDRHRGSVPDVLADLLSLPGVGPYTARAVLVFAFEAHVGVVDTNIARILARRAGRRLGPSEAQALADGWVPLGRSWQWNQVLMDLGASRCRPTPDCDGCPVACSWRDGGHRAPDPAHGSAGVSGRQARFAGSDRQLRGRVLAAITTGGHGADEIRRLLLDEGTGAERVAAVVDSLVAEGLLARDEEGRIARP